MAKMDLTRHLMDVHKKLSTNEELLRLLYYRAADRFDDVTDGRRPNIIGNNTPIESGNHNSTSMLESEIINDTIRLSKIVDDLSDDNPKCVIAAYFEELDIVYDARGIPLVNLLDVNAVFDIYAHYDFERTDFRLMKLLTKIYTIFYDNTVTGMGKFSLVSSAPIDSKEELNSGYVGYRVQFKFRTTAK